MHAQHEDDRTQTVLNRWRPWWQKGKVVVIAVFTDVLRNTLGQHCLPFAIGVRLPVERELQFPERCTNAHFDL